ncbi:MAG: hydrogenase maturation protease [bacterium]|nr:hydrogenase maturation protease [bacterium]
MRKRRKTAVIGLGNRLLADEGAGLHAVEYLREQLQNSLPDVDLVEAGLPGPALLHQFDEREKIIFIDAGNVGMQPGQYKRFTPDEVSSRKDAKGISLHEFDLIKFLEFAKQMGMAGSVEVVIYCFQAAEIIMSENLSPVVQKNLPLLAEDVCNELKYGHAKGTANA